MSEGENNINISSQENGKTIYFSDFWRGFIKLWWIAAILMLLFGGIMFYRSYVRFSPLYKSSVTFAVHTENSVLDGENGLSAYSFYYNRNIANQLAEVFPYVLQNNILKKEICEDLNLSYMPATVSAVCVSETNMVTVTAIGADPQLTYDVLLSVLDNYDVVAEYIIGRTQLVMITEPQVPVEPYNTHSWKMSTLKGVLFGLAIGLGCIALYGVMRSTIRTKEDIHYKLNQHCIGVLPHVVFKRYKKQPDKTILINNPLIGNQFLESVRLLRSAVQNAITSEDKVILLASSAAGEGKSVTTLNLAGMFARNDMRILVIDGDMRDSGICRILGLDNSKMQESQNKDEAPLYSINHVDSLGIDLLSFNVSPKRIYRILRPIYLKKLLDSAREKYDLILIDTPPCGLIADASVFAEVSDVALYVIRQDYVMDISVRSSINTLMQTDVRLLGCVLNGVTSGIGSYGYNYGYGYGYYNYKSYRYGNYK